MKEVMFDLVTDLGIEYVGYYRFDFADYDYYLGIVRDKATTIPTEWSVWYQNTPVYLSPGSFDCQEFDIIEYDNDTHSAEKVEINQAPDRLRYYMLKEMI